ncbi:MAG: hypothetical protein RMJ87_08500 [Cytophagales bacterium]|nr:hypothetical protein [Cytophagales bacterium]
MNDLLANITEEKRIMSSDFNLSYQDKWGSIYTSKQQKPSIFICTIHTPYLFEQDFKKLLHQCTVLAQKNSCEKFIFDVRKAHILQYSSLEWYYLHWKPMMYREFQLAVHRKLYLMTPWFLAYIEDCRKEIYKKAPNNICHHLDIKACVNLIEAINQ